LDGECNEKNAGSFLIKTFWQIVSSMESLNKYSKPAPAEFYMFFLRTIKKENFSEK